MACRNLKCFFENGKFCVDACPSTQNFKAGLKNISTIERHLEASITDSYEVLITLDKRYRQLSDKQQYSILYDYFTKVKTINYILYPEYHMSGDIHLHGIFAEKKSNRKDHIPVLMNKIKRKFGRFATIYSLHPKVLQRKGHTQQSRIDYISKSLDNGLEPIVSSALGTLVPKAPKKPPPKAAKAECKSQGEQICEANFPERGTQSPLSLDQQQFILNLLN